jgi:hypothetical protein
MDMLQQVQLAELRSAPEDRRARAVRWNRTPVVAVVAVAVVPVVAVSVTVVPLAVVPVVVVLRIHLHSPYHLEDDRAPE